MAKQKKKSTIDVESGIIKNEPDQVKKTNESHRGKTTKPKNTKKQDKIGLNTTEVAQAEVNKSKSKKEMKAKSTIKEVKKNSSAGEIFENHDRKAEKKKDKRKKKSKKSIAAKVKDGITEIISNLKDVSAEEKEIMAVKKDKAKKEKAEKLKKERPKKPEEKFLLEIASNLQVMRDFIVQSPKDIECAPGVQSIGNGIYATPNIAAEDLAEQHTQKLNARRNAYRLALADLYLNANMHCDIAQTQACAESKSCKAVLDGKITIKENAAEEKIQWHDEHGNHHIVIQYKYVLSAAFVCRCGNSF